MQCTTKSLSVPTFRYINGTEQSLSSAVVFLCLYCTSRFWLRQQCAKDVCLIVRVRSCLQNIKSSAKRVNWSVRWKEAAEINAAEVQYIENISCILIINALAWWYSWELDNTGEAQKLECWRYQAKKKKVKWDHCQFGHECNGLTWQTDRQTRWRLVLPLRIASGGKTDQNDQKWLSSDRKRWIIMISRRYNGDCRAEDWTHFHISQMPYRAVFPKTFRGQLSMITGRFGYPRKWAADFCSDKSEQWRRLFAT